MNNLKNNMQKEKYSIWKPTEDQIFTGSLLQITTTGDGLSILLDEAPANEKKLRIVFENVFAYRLVRESYRQDIRPFMPIDRPKSWPLYRTTDSDYIDWLKNIGGVLIPDDLNLVHFIIFTLNEVIDVIDNTEPSIELL